QDYVFKEELSDTKSLGRILHFAVERARFRRRLKTSEERLRAILTEHRHMNEMVDFERHRLWQVISEAPVAIALLDSQLRFITCSQKFITDYGILTKDIFAKRLWDILPWMAEKWAPMCERALAGD